MSLGYWRARRCFTGPSLVGVKILLPLDIVSSSGSYLAKATSVEPHNPILSDLVLLGEPSRRFIGAELRAGRLPVWNPNQYAGVPEIAAKFSPFILLLSAVESPVIIAWVQLLAALVAGTGFYVFCRASLRLGFWPSAVAGWCYPVTGFFVLWQGFGLVFVVVWMPWLFLAVERTIRKPLGYGSAGVSLFTALALLSGALDIAGQVLLGSGLFAGGLLLLKCRRRRLFRRALGGALALSLAWSVGFMLASPYLLPTLEYTATGERMIRRGSGVLERPPLGLAAVPQMLFPLFYGDTQAGSVPIFPRGEPNLLESPAGGYAGLIALLLLAPLAWQDRRRRRYQWIWLGLGLFGVSWSLNMPGLVQLLKLPGLNMMSHNRLVLLAGFAVLAMAAGGLQVLWSGRFQWQRWFWLPIGVLVGFGAWNLSRALFLPEQIASGLPAFLARRGGGCGGHR